MKSVSKSTKNHFHIISSHVKKHHKKYLFGIFGSFALVKTFLLFGSFLGLIHMGNTFAYTTLVLNSTNITQAPFNCPTSATNCQLIYKNITDIADDTFINHHNLTNLYLSNNDISSIDPDDFNGLSSLKVLYIQNNRISTFSSGIFSDLTSLEELHIGNPDGFTSIDANAFNGLPNLFSLGFSASNISSISEPIFSVLPSLRQIYFINNSISSLSNINFNGISGGLQQLYLQDNQISSIEDGDLDNFTTSLEYLDLANNQITSISDHAFESVNGIIHLYLNGNQISSINANTFSGLNSLETLYLNNNQLTTIEDDYFDDLVSLMTFNLGTNQISSIEPNSFNQLSLLSYLDLSSNQLETLDVNTFNGLSSLEQLSLSTNNISFLYPNIFAGTPKLLILDLNSNFFTSIKTSTFNSLPLLNELYLNYNQITSLEKDCFADFPALTTLSLDNNKITSLENGYFNGLSALNTLYLDYNQITSLAVNSFSDLGLLTTLYLNNNNIMSLEANDFAGLDSLNSLYLNNNNIVTIADTTFNILPSLTFLDASFNQITSIDTLDLTQLTNLTTVSFASNCNHNGGWGEINYGPNLYAQTDSDNCVAIAATNSYDIPTFTTNLESKGYALDGNNYYVGTMSVNLNSYQSGNKDDGYTTEYANTFLADTIMQSSNSNNYEEEYYQHVVEIQYEEGTSVTIDGQPYNGIVHAPKLFTITSAPSIAKPVTLMKFGSFTDRLDFSQPVTIRMPALDKNIGDSVDIYSSNGNIYTDTNLTWNFEDTVTVIDKDGVPYIEFTVDHATYFATTLPVGQGGGPFTGDFTINNDDASTTSQNVTLNISTTPIANQMRFSNDGVSRSTREAYATNKAWTLSAGYASKTVYAQFDTDGDDIFEAEVSDTILYTDGSTPGGGSNTGALILEIIPGNSSCTYGTSLDLGSHVASFDAFTMTGSFTPSTWSCTDIDGLSNWALTINASDLTNQYAHIISASDIFMSTDYNQVVEGTCTTGAAELSSRAPIDTDKAVLEKASTIGEICTIAANNVQLAVQVAANQAVGIYTGTLTVTLPIGF